MMRAGKDYLAPSVDYEKKSVRPRRRGKTIARRPRADGAPSVKSTNLSKPTLKLR